MTDWFEVAKDICSSPSGRNPGPMPPPPNAAPNLSERTPDAWVIHAKRRRADGTMEVGKWVYGYHGCALTALTWMSRPASSWFDIYVKPLYEATPRVPGPATELEAP
jgi:hypothetical protein